VDVHVKGKHIESAVEDHVPFGLYGINFKPPVESRKRWDDVGGLAEAKQMLLETLKWPTQVEISLE
jgi:peroxin-1